MSDTPLRDFPATTRQKAGDLRALLRCPRCGNERLSWSDVALSCQKCSSDWPVLDGDIPYFAHAAIAADAALREEVACQDRAADIYDDARSLAFHSDRVTLGRLAAMFTKESGLALDLGSGVGQAAEPLARFDLVGVDVSKALLRRAQARGEFVVGADARALPFAPETFDVILARGILHHMTEPASALRQAHRVLKTGGELVVHDPRAFRPLEVVKRALRHDSEHFSRSHTAFSPAAYRQLIESAGFHIERFEVWDPVSILLIAMADLLHLGRLGAAPRLTRTLIGLDARFQNSLGRLRRFQEWGFILVAHARKEHT